MNSRLALRLIAAAAIAAASRGGASAGVITDWSFEQYTGTYTYPNTPLNSPAPTTGTGTATPLGMTNSYTYNGGEGPGSITWCDTTTGNGGGISWRIRGPSNSSGGGPGIANGWNSAAPQYTQGAEFAVSTVGYTNVHVSFDWESTTQGVANLQPRYSLGGGTTWANIGPLLNMNPADVNTNFDTFNLDLSGIPGASNNPNLAIELVSAYDPATGAYASATSFASGNPVGINNSSGNWRFDNIDFTGDVAAVPEPSSFILFGLAAGSIFGGWIVRRRRWANVIPEGGRHFSMSIVR